MGAFDEQRFADSSGSSMPSMNSASVTRLLRALRAFSSASAYGYTGAPALPGQRFVRAADALRQCLRSHHPLCLRSLSGRAPCNHSAWLRWRASNPGDALRARKPIAASAIVPRVVVRARGCARWGLTTRSTGPAGTCFDLPVTVGAAGRLTWSR
jgi:hypothetical protein